MLNLSVCVGGGGGGRGLFSSADPEGGTGGPDPSWKITSYMGFYSNKQLYPLWKMLNPSGTLKNDKFY